MRVTYILNIHVDLLEFLYRGLYKRRLSLISYERQDIYITCLLLCCHFTWVHSSFCSLQFQDVLELRALTLFECRPVTVSDALISSRICFPKHLLQRANLHG